MSSELDTSCGKGSTGSETILLVDDEVALVKMMTTILRKPGYAVEASQDPLKALAMFTATPDRFDLIITDMAMPRMDGLKLAAAIKKIRPSIPVIMCTGHSGLIHADSMAEAGIAELITKPIRPAKIAEVVRRVLDETCAPAD